MAELPGQVLKKKAVTQCVISSRCNLATWKHTPKIFAPSARCMDVEIIFYVIAKNLLTERSDGVVEAEATWKSHNYRLHEIATATYCRLAMTNNPFLHLVPEQSDFDW